MLDGVPFCLRDWGPTARSPHGRINPRSCNVIRWISINCSMDSNHVKSTPAHTEVIIDTIPPCSAGLQCKAFHEKVVKMILTYKLQWQNLIAHSHKHLTVQGQRRCPHEYFCLRKPLRGKKKGGSPSEFCEAQMPEKYAFQIAYLKEGFRYSYEPTFPSRHTSHHFAIRPEPCW